MSSRIDMPLDNLVKSSRGRGRGRGVGGAQKMATRQRGGGGGRGIKKGGPVASRGASNITARLGFTTKLKTAQNGSTNVQKVSDLRDVLATKTKTSMPDLRTKLPPKPASKQEKKKSTNQPRGRSPLRISSDMFRTAGSKGRTTTRSKDAIFSKSSRETERSLSRRLPTTSEAKKITVTVQGLSKTTNEAYRKEERLAAVITRQKESRQQNFMRTREEFIASSITSALTGDGRGPGESTRGGPSIPVPYHRYRSPSPPPMLDYHEPPSFPPPPSLPMAPPPRHRPQGITSVTTLVISNLNDTVSHSDVLELCNAIGPVESVAMTAPGVTEVTFRYKDDALEAYKKYNQRNLDGMPMMCRLQPGHSRPPATRPLPVHTHQVNPSYSRGPEPFVQDTFYGSYY